MADGDLTLNFDFGLAVALPYERHASSLSPGGFQYATRYGISCDRFERWG